MILVVGATGLVGSEVCRRLVQRGERVRAFVRGTSAAEKVEALRSFGAEICLGDLKEPESVAAACVGVESVVSTASCTFSRQAGDSIATVDAAGQMNLVAAAKAAGVGGLCLCRSGSLRRCRFRWGRRSGRWRERLRG